MNKRYTVRNITRFRLQAFSRKYHIINCLKLSLYVLHKSIQIQDFPTILPFYLFINRHLKVNNYYLISFILPASLGTWMTHTLLQMTHTTITATLTWQTLHWTGEVLVRKQHSRNVLYFSTEFIIQVLEHQWQHQTTVPVLNQAIDNEE